MSNVYYKSKSMISMHDHSTMLSLQSRSPLDDPPFCTMCIQRGSSSLIVLLVPCISNAAAYGLPPAARACLAFSILAWLVLATA